MEGFWQPSDSDFVDSVGNVGLIFLIFPSHVSEGKASGQNSEVTVAAAFSDRLTKICRTPTASV